MTDAAADWMSLAACLGVDPELFFPAVGAHNADTGQAKQICRGCPVQVPCLEHALEAHETFGIWGGTSERERRRIRRLRVRGAA